VSRKKRRKQYAVSSAPKTGQGKPNREEQLDRPWRFSLFAMIAIGVLGSIVYSNTFDVPFVFDDENNIVQNEEIQVSEFDLGQFYNAAMHSRAPRPVAFLSFALNHYFHEYELAGYHFVNLVIHLINGMLVYFLASYTYRLILGGNHGALDTSNDRTVGWLSLFAACLFVAHPMQAQAVTYVVQRMTSLSTMFYLSALLLYILGRLNTSKQKLLWVACFVSGLLALGSKQIAITLPVVILLYEWYFFRDLEGQWARRGAKYLIVLAVVLGGISLIFLGTSPWQHLVDGYDIRDFTMGERVLTQFRVVVWYLGMIVWPLPSRLNLIPYISTSHSLFDPITTLLSILTVGGFLGLSIYLARRQRLVSFCILWFFINLALESSVIALEMIYEHRVYLPMFGIVLAVPFLLQKAFAKQPALVSVLAVVMVLALSRGSYVRNEDWRDEEGLWTDVMSKNPYSHRAYSSIGNIRWQSGRHDLAIPYFNKSIELKSDYAKSYNNRGNCYSEIKKYDLAVADYAKAIQLDPQYVTAYANRGSVYGETKQYELAVKDYNKALELNPNYAPAFYNRSLVHSRMGNFDLAIKDISVALEYKPDEPGLLSARAGYHWKQGNLKQALSDYQATIELDSNKMPDLQRLAWLLSTAPDAEDRDGKQALEYAQQALRLPTGKNVDCLEALAAAYAEIGNYSEAVQWQAKAIERAPENRRLLFRKRLELYLSKQPFHHRKPNKQTEK